MRPDDTDDETVISRPGDDEISFDHVVRHGYGDEPTPWTVPTSEMRQLLPAHRPQEPVPYSQWPERRLRADFWAVGRHSDEGEPTLSFEVSTKCPPGDSEEDIHFRLNEGTMCSDWVKDPGAWHQFRTLEDEAAFAEHCRLLESQTEELGNGVRTGPCLCAHVRFTLLPGQGVPQGRKAR